MTKIISTISWIMAIIVASSLAIVAPAFAQTSVGVNVQGGVHDGANGGAWHGPMMPPGIFGTVTAVNGDTLTVTGQTHVMRPMPEGSATGTQAHPVPPVAASPTVYTVDATNAKIYKGSATSTVSVSAINVGDTVIVQGTVSGTNVAATVIRDGVMPARIGGPGMPRRVFGGASSTASGSGTPIIQGNGEPVVGGNVTAINGTTLTVTNAGNVTYTIDAASSTVVVKGASSTLANVAVGDNVIVQGVVNGNSVTASSIIDQGAKPGTGSANGSSTPPRGNPLGFFGGLFGAVGGFFQHLFGF